MDEEEPLLRTVALELANETRARPGEHPTAAAMHDYLSGTLADDRQAALQEHLSACAVCTQEVLELEEFLSAEISADERAAAKDAWLPMRARLIAEGILPGTVAAQPIVAVPSARFGRPAEWLTWALAASTAALLATTTYFAGQARVARRPRANVAIADLVPAAQEPTLRDGSSPEEVVVPAAADRLLLTLAAPPGEPFGVYRLEIHDGPTATARPRWAGEVEGRTRSGNFNLDLPRDFLPDGEYLIRVVRRDEGIASVLADYPLRLRHER